MPPSRDFQSDSGGAAVMRPGKRWSLWDMMNFNLVLVCSVLELLQSDENNVLMRINQPIPPAPPGSLNALANALSPPLPDMAASAGDKDRYKKLMDAADVLCDSINLDAAKYRVKLFRDRLKRQPLDLHDLHAEIRALREAIEGDIRERDFYYYPIDRAKLLRSIKADWEPVLAKLKNASNDIYDAVDCYALDHPNACVFHLMRAMEMGVQALGKKLGVNFIKHNPGRRVSELTWEQILNELNPKLKALSQKTAASKRRYERFSAIQSYLYGVKDAWRNPTMHPRAEGYNDLQARDILNHVRSFMSGLAEVL